LSLSSLAGMVASCNCGDIDGISILVVVATLDWIIDTIILVMVFLVIALLSLSVGLVVSIVPVLCIGWGGLGGYEISGVSSHSPLECGFGYSGLLHRRVSIQFVLLILIYVIFDVEVVLLSGLLCSWYSDIVGYKVLVYIGLTLWLETMLGKVMWFTCDRE